MQREFMYILDYSTSRVIKTKIAICESHLDGEDLVNAVISARLHMNPETCAWMTSTDDLDMEEIPIEKIPAKNYALGLKGSHPELSVWYHPNPSHTEVIVGQLDKTKNLGVDPELWKLLEMDSEELGVQLIELKSVDQIQNYLEVIQAPRNTEDDTFPPQSSDPTYKIENSEVEVYANQIRDSFPQLTVWIHPNPSNKFIMIAELKKNPDGTESNVIDENILGSLTQVAKSAGFTLQSLCDADQIQNLVEIK